MLSWNYSNSNYRFELHKLGITNKNGDSNFNREFLVKMFSGALIVPTSVFGITSLVFGVQGLRSNKLFLKK